MEVSITPDTILSNIVGLVAGLVLGVFIVRTTLHELRFHVNQHCDELDAMREKAKDDAQMIDRRLNDHSDRLRKLESEDSYRRGREGR